MSVSIKDGDSITYEEMDAQTDWKLNTILKDIREAVAGSQQDFTQGSIGRAILLLSVPMVLEMAMESIFAVVDIFFVSKLGSDAVATVGITESMLTIVYAIGIGLAMATTAMVARRIGEKNPEGASIGAVQAILAGIFISLPVSVTGILFAPKLLELMGASSAIVGSGNMYTAIMLGGNVVIMLLFIINSVFRGAGDAAIAMRVLWLANLINIILDPCLIFGLGPFPELGIKGAAIATTIGRGTGVLFQFYLLQRKDGRIRVFKDNLKIQFAVMKRLLRLSLGGIGQFIIATSSWIGLVRIMAVFGSEALAGYTIAIRIIVFSILPSWGMSNAAATLVGQNLGAQKPDRAEKAVWKTAMVNMVFLCAIGVVFNIFSEFLVRLFTDEPKVVAIGADCLRFISFGYPIYAYGMIMIQAFNGAGDTTTPTVMNFFVFWLIEIPVAYVLALSLGFNERGVYLAIILAESLLGIIGIILFRRGRWQKKVV
ncbi:MAG: MATE family efflux transporter [bacterium]